MRRALPLLVFVTSCTVYDPLFCDEAHPCDQESARPFCDLTGITVESEGIPRTCVGWPWDAGSDAPACTEELCDGLNNDCDTETDEDWPDLDRPCTLGQGACERTGMFVCAENQQELRCDAVPGKPALAETCADGLDDDCDGEPDDGCPAPVVPRWPWNGATTGSIHATSATLAVKPLRPTFKWDAAAEAVTYDLQIDESCTTPGFATCTFPSPLPGLTEIPATSYTPTSDLLVSTAQPVGRRYYWRVRGCNELGCGLWSPVRYVDVGRQSSDFNGDGYADVAIGAPGYDLSAAAQDAGRVYIYYGGLGTSLDTTADAIRTGAAAGDWFGHAVSPAGDVNADGYADLVVGAYLADAGVFVNAGRAYVYFGGPLLDTVPDVLSGTGNNHWFGNSVSSAGDTNGDGYADVVVGSPQSVGGTGSGIVRIYYGGTGATLDETPDLTLAGMVSGDDFGTSVAGGGDINNDGFADMVIGADQADVGVVQSGRSYIFLGGSSPSISPAVTFDGIGANDNFGLAVAIAGDLNGDSFGDVVIGAWHNDALGANAGQAYVYMGGTAIDSDVDTTLNGPGKGSEYALSVSPAGDANADGFADLVIGAESVLPGGTAYVYFGGAGGSLNTVADGTLVAETAGDSFGNSVGSAADSNGDGFDDVLVGAWDANASGISTGRAYVYRGGGGTNLNVVPDGTMSGVSLGDFFGTGMGGLP